MGGVTGTVARYRTSLSTAAGIGALALLALAATGNAEVVGVRAEDAPGGVRIAAGVLAVVLAGLGALLVTGTWPGKRDEPDAPEDDLDAFVPRPELDDVESRLRDHRLVTVVGPTGAGKSRLAREVWRRRVGRDDPPQVLRFVPLRDVTGLDALPRLARGLRSGRGADADPVDVLTDWFGNRLGLLILDDCDDALEPVATALRRLLTTCRRVTVLTTSQSDIPIETSGRVEVGGLDVPPPETDVDAARRYSAIRLFLQLGRGLVLRSGNVSAIVSVCRRLDGLPGPIKLVTGQLDLRTPQQLDQALADVTAKVSPADAALDVSHQRLSAPERVLFRRLAVFEGPFVEAVVPPVCAPDQVASEVLNHFHVLVRRRLVTRLLSTEDRPGARLPPDTAYFRLLGPHRGYARRRLLEEEGEAGLQLLRGRHAAAVIELVEGARPRITTAARREVLAELSAVSNDVDAALAHGAENDPGLMRRLAASLFWFWNFRGELSEGERWLAAALSSADGPTGGSADVGDAPGGTVTLARLHYARGGITFLLGDQTIARKHLTAAVDGLGAVAPESADLGLALLLLGTVQLESGEVAAAEDHAAYAVSMLDGLGLDWPLALALNDHGNVRASIGDVEAARGLYSQALGLWLQLTDRWGESLTRDNLGSLVWRVGGTDSEYEAAEVEVRTALVIQDEDGDIWGAAWSHRALGELALRRGRLEVAESEFLVSQEMHERVGRVQLVADCLSGLARVAIARGNDLWAAETLGAVQEVRERLAISQWRVERVLHEQALATLSSRLGTEPLERALRAGRERVRRTASGLLTAGVPPGPRAAPGAGGAGGYRKADP